MHGTHRLPCTLQDVKKHDDPELLVMPTDEALFADEGFRRGVASMDVSLVLHVCGPADPSQHA